MSRNLSVLNLNLGLELFEWGKRNDNIVYKCHDYTTSFTYHNVEKGNHTIGVQRPLVKSTKKLFNDYVSDSDIASCYKTCFIFPFHKKGGTICPDNLEAYTEALQEI